MPTIQPPATFFSLKTQFENAGDALINRELVRFCAKHSEVYVDVSRCPPDFAASMAIAKYVPQAHEVSSAAIFTKLVSERISGRRVYYFLGPGIYFGPRRWGQATKLLINTFVLLAMRILGVRICQVGVSYEKLTTFHSTVLRIRTYLMYRVLTRDQESFSYARQLGFDVQGVAPDLAFGAVDYRPYIAGDTTVAFSFRSDQSTVQRDQISQLVASLDSLLPKTLNFKFISQVGRDAPFMRELSQAQYSVGRLISYEETFLDADVALGAYRGCRFVVSNRLHAVLFGLVGGCAPVPVADSSVSRKIIGVIGMLDVRCANVGDGSTAVMSVLAENSSGRIDISKLSLQQLALLDHSFQEIFERH